MRFIYVLLITSVIALTNAKKRSSCRAPVILQDFDTQAILGPWFEYSRHHHDFEAGCDCLTSELVAIDANNIQITSCCQVTGASNETQNCEIGLNHVTQTNPEKKDALFKYTRVGSPIESDIWIIDTDYENYLIGNGCDRVSDDEEREVFWILSRDKEITETEANKINKVLKDNNFEKSKIIKQRHGADFGIRHSNDSLVMIYYNDQTIAVVELGPAKLLLNCELIEIYDDNDGVKLLQNLATINKPLEITFKDMVKLMNQCDIVEKQNEINRHPHLARERSVDGGGLFPQNPFSLLSGIIPGTKWCGTGDIATSYSDLGVEKTMDRCCRHHDLCPVKIRAYQKRYKLNNNSLYTKSHCTCDDVLYSCLKKTNTSAAQVMGSIYFNLVQVPCLQETQRGLQFRKAREGF